MPMDMKEILSAWEGLGVVVRWDAPSQAWIFIALHDDTLGRPTGGTRMKVYPRPEEGLVDAQRLAQGMTDKWAAVDFPFGGAKAVIALSHPLEGEERKRLLRLYGQLVESLHGSFGTGEDLGTTPEDMSVIAGETSHVMGGLLPGSPVSDPGPFTARGVYVGMRAALKHAFGEDRVAGRRVLIQGVGDVGRPLAELLAADGAELLFSDLHPRVEELAATLGATVVPVDEIYTTPCDVYAPCAVGATLNHETIPELACRVVAGSANNQLAEPEDADRLHRRGILYAPDYVVNGGGAIAFGLAEIGTHDPEELYARVEKIGGALDEIFAEAAERHESPLQAARRRVERALAKGRSEA